MIRTKLKKPYKSFPLTPHPRGGWAKVYRGRYCYIAIPDPKLALAEFNRRARQIDAGRPPTALAAAVAAPASIKWLCNRYLMDRKADLEAGKLEEETYLDYRDACRKLIAVVGADYLVADLTPDAFALVGRRMAAGISGKPLGPHALARNIQAIRSMFRHAALNLWIKAPANFGTRFSKPQVPRKRGNPLTTEELRKLVESSQGPQLAQVLLMANCAYTPRDLVALPVSAIRLDDQGGVILFPRPKMAKRRPIDRAAVLWPETIAALRAVETQNAERKDGEEGSGLVFQGARGGAISTRSISQAFGGLCEAAGVKRRGPAWIRHWFRTVADETDAATPVARVMGHRLAGMAEVYVDRVEHGRVAAVCEYVGAKLLGPIQGPAPRLGG